MIHVCSSNFSTTHFTQTGERSTQNLWRCLWCGLNGSIGLPWEVFASWCRPGDHVGEAHFVLDRQAGVMHVVELLLSKSRQKQALPWNSKDQTFISQANKKLMLSQHPDQLSFITWEVLAKLKIILIHNSQKWFPGPGNHRPMKAAISPGLIPIWKKAVHVFEA